MSSTLGAGAVAALRHDLRTPLNHITGYAEMLMEDATAAGRENTVARLRRVRDGCAGIVPLIQNALGSREEVGEPELGSLRREMRTPLAAIRSELLPLIESGDPGMEQDLRKMQGAVERLLGFAVEPTLGWTGASAESGASSSPAQPEAGPAQPGGEFGQPGELCGRLLVVDDNESNRDMLSRRLIRQGHTVATASNGREALLMVRQGGFDLVLLDVMMPEVDGIEVLAQIKSDPALREIPVIMISALDTIQSVARCIEMGAEDYLSKPFDPVLLRARIGASLDKRRLREQLVMQDKLASLGALTAGIAHEIKNPLNFVTNFAEVGAELVSDLREDLGADAARVGDLLVQIEDSLAKIRQHGRRADSIVRGMLMHSRGQSGECQLFDLNALLAENLNLAYHGMRSQNSSFDTAIVTDYGTGIAKINAIPQDISRVFLNLTSNAFYAVHAKAQTAGPRFSPTVWVRTRDLGGRVEVRIRDNGNGIPESARGKIFTPFFTTKPAGSGTGLGLSISYDIVVRGHKGEIRVESEAGSFAEFIVILPREGGEGTK